eukprot:14439_1
MTDASKTKADTPEIQQGNKIYGIGRIIQEPFASFAQSHTQIISEMDMDSCYVDHRDALAEPIIPHGFATKTKGAMAYFIGVSGMIFIGKSN